MKTVAEPYCHLTSVCLTYSILLKPVQKKKKPQNKNKGWYILTLIRVHLCARGPFITSGQAGAVPQRPPAPALLMSPHGKPRLGRMAGLLLTPACVLGSSAYGHRLPWEKSREARICAGGLRGMSGASDAPVTKDPRLVCSCAEGWLLGVVTVRLCKKKLAPHYDPIKSAEVWIWKELIICEWKNWTPKVQGT